MKTLSYKTLEENGYDGYLLKDAPERVLQFGEGNFLRAFVDYFIDLMNEKAGFNSKVVLVQPIAAPMIHDMINDQDGLYTLYLRGQENGQAVNKKRVISCVSRCIDPYAEFDALMACADNPDLRFITCNTTEAGIAYDPNCKFEDKPAASYPGKLCQFMYRRFQKFGDQKGKGFIILSCELIDNNGKELKKCLLQYADLWNLGDDFKKWIDEENIICSTLVDRIVPGRIRDAEEVKKIEEENGYHDDLVDVGEVFGFWVIEGPQSIKDEFPAEKASLPILICDDHKPYKQRKVRILNGAHTSFVLGAYLAGENIVRDCMHDETIHGFMDKLLYEEVIPTLTLDPDDCKQFASDVTDRFANPYVDHQLLSISLNSTSKWKARVMPSFKGYVEKYGKLPACITASFAFYEMFYHQGKELTDKGLEAVRPSAAVTPVVSGPSEYVISDDRPILEFYYAHKDDDVAALTHAVLSNTDFWGEDLTKIEGFEEAVTGYAKMIEEKGAYEVMKSCLN